MSTPPPGGSTRMTSAPSAARVAPPSGAATKAESSTIRKPSRMAEVTPLQAEDLTSSPGKRLVYKLAGRRLGGGTSRLLECRQHLSRPLLFLGHRGEDIVDDRQLAGVDRRLGLLAQAIIVIEHRVHTIAGRRLGCGSGCYHQKGTGEQRLGLASPNSKVGSEIKTAIGKQLAGRR